MIPAENDIRYLMYEDKRLKERPVAENIAPTAVEERAVDTPFDHSDDIESMKNSIDALEEAFRYLKCKIKQLRSVPVQDSSTIDHNDDID